MDIRQSRGRGRAPARREPRPGYPLPLDRGAGGALAGGPRRRSRPDGPRALLDGGDDGASQGELVALRWQDVDWSAGVVRVRRSLSRGQLGTPKSRRSSRAVPLADRVAAELERLYQGSPFQDDADIPGGPLVRGPTRSAGFPCWRASSAMNWFSWAGTPKTWTCLQELTFTEKAIRRESSSSWLRAKSRSVRTGNVWHTWAVATSVGRSH